MRIRSSAVRVGLAVLIVVAACRRAPREVEPSPGPGAGPERSASAGSAPPAPEPLLPLRDRQAGGRPVSWWRDYLQKLRATGPAPIFELAVSRARANGLHVNVTDAGVTVDAPAEQAGGTP